MQSFGLQLVSGPVAEPVTLERAKLHLRVDFNDDDELITGLITAAREATESMMNRVIFDQAFLLTLDQFPCAPSVNTYPAGTHGALTMFSAFFSWYSIKVPRSKLKSVTSITYVDTDGSTKTLDSALYNVDANGEPGRIVPRNGQSWPYPDSYVPGSVKVTFVAGSYGDGTDITKCPASIAQAMLLLIGHWYANREAASEKPLTNLPLAVDALLAPHKFYGAC